MLAWHCAVAAFCGLLLPLRAQDHSPDFPKAFAGRAEFETTEGFKKAGWASVVTAQASGVDYILTVRHLLGPEGGFSNQVTAAHVPAFVRFIKIDSFSGGMHGYLVSALQIATSEVDPHRHPIGNLAIFSVHNAEGAQPDVLLSGKVPAADETVWLTTNAGGTGLSLVAATVVGMNADGWLTVHLKVGTPDKNSSGAPVLNSAGELVGVFSHLDGQNPTLLDLLPASAILKALPQPQTKN